MSRKENEYYKKLLSYEIETLRFINKIEDIIITFGFEGEFMPDIPSCDYKMLEIVLDELGAPKDNKAHRDNYNNIYYNFYTDNTNTDINILLKNLRKELNESKKRIHK